MHVDRTVGDWLLVGWCCSGLEWRRRRRRHVVVGRRWRWRVSLRERTAGAVCWHRHPGLWTPSLLPLTRRRQAARPGLRRPSTDDCSASRPTPGTTAPPKPEVEITRARWKAAAWKRTTTPTGRRKATRWRHRRRRKWRQRRRWPEVVTASRCSRTSTTTWCGVTWCRVTSWTITWSLERTVRASRTCSSSSLTLVSSRQSSYCMLRPRNQCCDGLSVCLSLCKSALTRSFSDGGVAKLLLPVLWITSFIMRWSICLSHAHSSRTVNFNAEF